MKGNSLKKSFLSFIEISLSLSVLVFVFYFLSNFSSDLFLKISSKNINNILESNRVKMASVIALRDQDFLDSIDNKIKIAFVGDTMLDRGVEQKVKKEGDDNFNFVFEEIKDDLKQYDFLIGNLEGPVSNKGKDKYNLYSFRMNPEVIPVLKEVGFEAFSVANNHMGDWGQEAMVDTFNRLKEGGIKVLGGGNNLDEAITPQIIEKDDVKIGFLAFSQFGQGDFWATNNFGGVAGISEENLKKGISVAREQADIIIVNFHFGEEYQEIQNSYQEKYAKMAIDFGANLVVGTHPHVIQPLEQYKNTYVAYSLGNFVFDQYFSPETMEGGLLEVVIENKKIENVILKRIKINTNYQPLFI